MDEFQYPNMTPALEHYLDLRGRHPGYKYAENDHRDATPESKAAVKAWQQEVEAIKAKLPEGEPDAYYKAHRVWLCRDETASGEFEEHLSQNGKYRLVVTRHSTGPNTWNYSKGRVYVGDTLLTEVCRNYGHFPFAWVEGHSKTDHDYLVCGEKYMGQTIINLVTGTHLNYEGDGFCWATINPNADGTLLAVHGCYWGAPYETRILDFNDPMSPPWEILATDNDGEFAGWTGPASCQIGNRYEVVNIEGHPLHGKREWDCNDKDLAEIDDYVAKHDLPGEDPGWLEVHEKRDWHWQPKVSE